MNNKVANFIAVQADAMAAKIEDRANAKEHVKASIRRTMADLAEMLCSFLDEDQAADRKLAVDLREGEPVMPPAAGLGDIDIDPADIVDLPSLPLSIADLAAPPSAEVETVPQPEQQAA